MALLDVTDVLADPDFTDTIAYVRTTVALVNGAGVPTAAAPVTIRCPVIPDPLTTVRQADGSWLSGAIQVFTTTQLTAGWVVDNAHSVDADTLIWKGQRYIVQSVAAFSSFGEGFYHVAAQLAQLNPNAAL